MRFFLFSILICCIYPAAVGQYCMEGRFGYPDTLFDLDQVVLDADIVYGEAINRYGELEELKLDVYRPRPLADTLPKRPTIIYYHGGGYHAGSKENAKGKEWALAFSRRGYVFVAVDYRIGWPVEDSCEADQNEYQRAVYRAAQDSRDAYRFVIEHADDYGIDTSWMFQLGASAGAGLSFFNVFYDEEDFASFLSEELGPLDFHTNDFNHPIRPRAVATRAGAVDNLDLLAKSDIPFMMFHGNCDLTVPYSYGPLFWCFTPQPFFPVHGSGDIADRMEELGRCFVNYKSLGSGHVAIQDDSVPFFVAPFFSDIMCGECNTERYVRDSGKNICRENSVERTWSAALIWPNPADQFVDVVITGPFDEIIPLRVVELSGRPVIEKTIDFRGPTMLVSLDLGALTSGVYVVQAGARIKQGRLLLVR